MMHTTLHPRLGSLRGCIFPQGSWLAKMLCGEFAADVYEDWQYGKIPVPIPPEPPGTPAMKPSGEAIYTPGQDVTVDLAKSSLERTQEAYLRYVDGLIAAGKYTPQGKLPLTAEEAEKVLKDYGPLLLIGGGVIVLLLLLRR